jgi:hypothetical protein
LEWSDLPGRIRYHKNGLRIFHALGFMCRPNIFCYLINSGIFSTLSVDFFLPILRDTSSKSNVSTKPDATHEIDSIISIEDSARMR